MNAAHQNTLEKVFAASRSTTKSGEEYFDLSKIGKALSDEVKPTTANIDIDPDGGKRLNIEFSPEDMKKIMTVNKAVNQIDEQQQIAMNIANGTTPVQPISNNTNIDFTNMAGLRTMGYYNGYNSGLSWYGDRNSWMDLTKEEIDSGKYPVSKVIRPGDEDYDKPKQIKRKKEQIIICVKRLQKDEDGKAHYEYYGDKEAVKHFKKEACVEDYKSAAQEAWRKIQLVEVYNLASELKRYNRLLSEQLLWYQHEASIDEFDEFKKMCLQKLADYRSKDPFAKVKSNIRVINGQTHILPTEDDGVTKEELDEYVKKLEAKAQEPSQKDKENAVIEKYQEESEERLGGIRKEIEAIENDNDPKSSIKKLQMLDNINVCCSQEEFEREMEWRERFKSRWTDQQNERKNQYSVWKQIMRCAMDQVPEGMSYDQWFDEWWNKPSKDAQDYYRKNKRAILSGQLSNKLTQIVASQPTPDQIKAAYEADIIRKYRAFDKGLVRDEGLNQFFNGEYGFAYLWHCHLQDEIKKQRQDLKRLYDPDALHDLFRSRSGTSNHPSLPKKADYDTLVNSEEYQKRRQMFIETIYKKNKLGRLR